MPAPAAASYIWLDSGELYDGVFDNYDANNDDAWDTNEYDDAGQSGWFDV